MKEFEKKEKEMCEISHCSQWDISCRLCEQLREEGWKEALKWARVKVENYTPEDVCYFIDEELKQ